MNYDKIGNNFQVKILAADYAHTGNIGFQDVTGFSLPMLANTNYRFEFNIIFQTSSISKGIGLAVNSAVSANYVLVYTEIPNSLTSIISRMERAYNTGTATTTGDAANTNCIARCYGFVSNGAVAGDLILRVNKNTDGGTATIMANSVMKLSRINPIN